MKPNTFIFRKKWIPYLYRNNTIWIDIISVCKALGLNEAEELAYMSKDKSLNLVAREFEFDFSNSFSEKTLCIQEIHLYQWLAHLSFSPKASLRDLFCSFIYEELRRKVKFDFPESVDTFSLNLQAAKHA